jgi:transposase
MSKAKQASQDEQRQFWRMVFETHQASGLSIKQFCQNEGISEAGFYSWRKKLAAVDERPKVAGVSAASAGFIEVNVPGYASVGLELVLSSGHTLRIPAGADSTLLGHVLSTLKQAGLC